MKQLAVVVLLAIIGIAGLTMVNRQAQIAYAATAQGTVQKSAT